MDPGAGDGDGKVSHTGDFVRIEETRPLSKLKRGKLKEIVKRSALATAAIAAEAAAALKTPEQAS